MQASDSSGGQLNSSQQSRLLITCKYIDKLLSDIESVLNSSSSKSPFPQYLPDLSSAQRRVIENYITRMRAQLLRILVGAKISVPRPSISAVHSLRTTLAFINVSVEELKPKYMSGYGKINSETAEALNGIVAELASLTGQFDSYVAAGAASDISGRLRNLALSTDFDVQILLEMNNIVSRHGLVEYRSALNAILDRLEDRTFEIAVFGKVSSGKSTLLNHILETDILPVGVTPITAVPTRIQVGAGAGLMVTFAGLGSQFFDISQISEFATEQKNPANVKRVAKLVVTLPSPKLRDGITFVDTPGLGSLAAAGTHETLAYLPRCDFGVVLVDAGSSLTAEDIDVMRLLHESGVPVSVLLSKADLVQNKQRAELLSYIEAHVQTELNIGLQAIPVSALPEYEYLLLQWYDRQLFPLIENAAQLRLESVSKRVDSLRTALISTLSSLQVGTSAVFAESLPAAEQDLRRFSGRFVQLEKDVNAVLDQIVPSPETLIRLAVEAALAVGPEESGLATRIGLELDSLVNGFGKQISGLISSLIPDIVEHSKRAAQAVSLDSIPSEQDLLNIVREMPRYEAPQIPAAIHVSKVLSLLGNTAIRSDLTRKVKDSIGETFPSFLGYYRTMLQTWSGSCIKRMNSTFDSYAELYRGQMRRLQTMSPEDEPLSMNGLAEEMKSLERMDIGTLPVQEGAN